MKKLPFDIHFCIYNFLEFEKKYEMRFILEDYNQLFINDINKQNISIELMNIVVKLLLKNIYIMKIIFTKIYT